MGVSKVVLGDETLIDLTSDSVSSENLLEGATAHGADGEEVIGGVVVTPMYTGTKAAIEAAIAAGQIPEDAIVNITDDEETSSFQTQINQINDSLGGITQFVVDETTGKISGYKTEIGGADTVFPFKSTGDITTQTITKDTTITLNDDYSMIFAFAVEWSDGKEATTNYTGNGTVVDILTGSQGGNGYGRAIQITNANIGDTVRVSKVGCIIFVK